MGWEGRYILGLKSNGLLKAYVGNSNAEDLIADGVVESFQGFLPILIDGNNTRNSLLDTTLWTEPTFAATLDLSPIKNKMYFYIENGKYIGAYNIPNFETGITYYEQTNNSRYPRQIIAQNTVTKDFYILSCSGKGKTSNLGLTLEECIAYLQSFGCSFAYMLDQGGSVSSAYRNVEQVQLTDGDNFVTRYTDGYGTIERKVADFIYFSKEINSEKDSALNEALAEINNLKAEINKIKVNLEGIDKINCYTTNPAKLINYTNGGTPSLAFGNLNHETYENDLLTSIGTNNENINFYDVVNSKSFARLLKSGGIQILKGSTLTDLAKIFNEADVVTNLNIIDKNSFSCCLGSSTGAPFNDETWRANFIITMVSTSLQTNEVRIQIGFQVANTPTKVAYRCYSNSNWSSWKYLTLADN